MTQKEKAKLVPVSREPALLTERDANKSPVLECIDHGITLPKRSSAKVEKTKIEKSKRTKEKKKSKDIVEMKESKEIPFEPHCVDSTKPENLISYTNIEIDHPDICILYADHDLHFQCKRRRLRAEAYENSMKLC